MFRKETSRIDQLSDVYRNAVKAHKAEVAGLSDRLACASRLMTRARYDGHECSKAVAIIASIRDAPELKQGMSAAHANFRPQQSP